MGLHRQGIQRIVNELEKEGIVEFKTNPHHKRAHLILLTPKGQKLFEAATALQVPWVNSLSSGLALKDIDAAKKVVDQLKTYLADELDNTN